MGHHLQNIRVLPPVTNEVDMELQADCFAGFALQTGERGGPVTRRQWIGARTVVGLIGDAWLAHIATGVPRSHAGVGSEVQHSVRGCGKLDSPAPIRTPSKSSAISSPPSAARR